MDKDGMLPKQTCHGCGKELNADGGHPAELYAGHLHGFCYDCELKAPAVIKCTPQGAMVWSCPPHCPSWRRDREQYFQFPGCDCDHGRRWYQGWFGKWSTGMHTTQCADCQRKHNNHPITIAAFKKERIFQGRMKAWNTRISKKVIEFMRDNDMKVPLVQEHTQPFVDKVLALVKKYPAPIRKEGT
jgi:hypothetical protein